MSGDHDPIGIKDAMKDPAAREVIETMIGCMRIALAPMLNADLDNLPLNQSYMMSAAALFAGMTAGHMICTGSLTEQDKRRAGEVVLKAFRSGIDLGKAEYQRAALEQLPTEGSA